MLSVLQCFLAAGLGSWNGDEYVPYARVNHRIVGSGARPASIYGRIPRVLLLGDSISRNLVTSACGAANLTTTRYIDCPGSEGGGYSCKAEGFELASFFIFGSELRAPYANSWSAPCAGLPEDTQALFESHISKAANAFTGDPNVVVISAEMWTIQNIQDRRVDSASFFKDERFSAFSHEYVHNMTLLVHLARIAYPNSTILLMKLPGAGENRGRLVNGRTIQQVNQVIQLASSRIAHTCTFDWQEMMSGYSGAVIRDDGRHPTDIASIEAANILLNIAIQYEVV